MSRTTSRVCAAKKSKTVDGGATPKHQSAVSSVGVPQAVLDASLVGKRVRMWWGGDDAWYTGRVAAFDAEIGGHTVKYDDGEEETYAMPNEKVRCTDGKR